MKKFTQKLIAMLLCVVMIGAWLPMGVSADDAVCEIDSVEDLYAFARRVNGGETTLNAKLTADIVLNRQVTRTSGLQVWTPIGYYASSGDYVRYAGTFDGNGHTITGLYCGDAAASYVGLVGYLAAEGTVKNVTVTGSDITGKTNVGGIVGYSYGGTVTGCSYSGTVTAASGAVGGIAGYCRSGSLIESCTVSGTVSGGGSNVGGIAGYTGGTIRGCSNTASVITATSGVGGIVGWVNNGTVEDCTNSGNVSSTTTGTTANAGGIAGNAAATITGCVNSGNVTGSAVIGGMVGQLSKGSTLTGSANTGAVTGNLTTKGQVGGVVGYAYGQSTGGVSISKCYNTGAVSGAYQYTGGVVGQAGYATIEDTYNTGAVTGASTYVGGVVGGFTGAGNTLSDSYSIGTVTGSKSYVGGVIGAGQGTVTGCYYLTGSAKDAKATVQNGTGNAAQGYVTADIVGATDAKTAAQFASGEVCWLLNGETAEGTLVWFQTLGTDASPKFEGKAVYCNNGVYSNKNCDHIPGAPVRENEKAVTCTEDGSYDTVIYCTICGGEISRETTTVPSAGHNFVDHHCTVCGAADGVACNTATDTVYTTVEEALDAAQAGQTVVLLADCTADTVLVIPGVTLDLKGYELTAAYAVGFDGARVYDTVGGGRLTTGMQNVVLDEDNPMAPVYDGTGYIFTRAGFAVRQDTGYQGEGIKINALVCPVDMGVVELLKDGSANNNIQIMIVMSWDGENGTGYQDFVYTDAFVSGVYNSNKGTWNGYGKMFTMVITGFDGFENLTARVQVVSGTNAIYADGTGLRIT